MESGGGARMTQHHRMPAAGPEPLFAPAGNEIRFPVGTGCKNTRSRKEPKA